MVKEPSVFKTFSPHTIQIDILTLQWVKFQVKMNQLTFKKLLQCIITLFMTITLKLQLALMNSSNFMLISVQWLRPITSLIKCWLVLGILITKTCMINFHMQEQLKVSRKSMLMKNGSSIIIENCLLETNTTSFLLTLNMGIGTLFIKQDTKNQLILESHLLEHQQFLLEWIHFGVEQELTLVLKWQSNN